MPNPQSLYIKWADEAASNASSLAEEAKILLENDKRERAYYLSHMAYEEATKAMFLKGVHYLGVSPDAKNEIDKLLSKHPVKIGNLLENIKTLAGREDSERSKLVIDSINNDKDAAVQFINNLKNNSMYVSIKDGKISTPKQSLKDLDIVTFVGMALSLAFQARSLNLNPFEK